MQITEAVVQKLRAVKALITDVDGVLTDGCYPYGAEGEVLKFFHTRDQVGLELAAAAGWPVLVVSQRPGAMVEAWARDMGIEACLGVDDKRTCVKELAAKKKLKLEQVVYLGDDLLDLPAMDLCGVSAAPADAAVLVRQKVDLVLSLEGGRGALRELVETTLERQGRLTEALAAYYRNHGCKEPGSKVPQEEPLKGAKIGFRR